MLEARHDVPFTIRARHWHTKRKARESNLQTLGDHRCASVPEPSRSALLAYLGQSSPERTRTADCHLVRVLPLPLGYRTVSINWSHRESHPNLQRAMLTLSCWTMTPMSFSAEAVGLEPTSGILAAACLPSRFLANSDDFRLFLRDTARRKKARGEGFRTFVAWFKARKPTTSRSPIMFQTFLRPVHQERPAGVEPAIPAWRAGRFPLHHGRVVVCRIVNEQEHRERLELSSPHYGCGILAAGRPVPTMLRMVPVSVGPEGLEPSLGGLRVRCAAANTLIPFASSGSRPRWTRKRVPRCPESNSAQRGYQPCLGDRPSTTIYPRRHRASRDGETRTRALVFPKHAGCRCPTSRQSERADLNRRSPGPRPGAITRLRYVLIVSPTKSPMSPNKKPGVTVTPGFRYSSGIATAKCQVRDG